MDRLLDNALTGPRYFVRPEIADMMVEAIDYRERQLRHYELHAFVVMANHVHLLVTPLIEPSKFMHSLKRFTAGQGNRMLGLAGPFWQDESYDRLVRNEKEFERILNYIEMNPVKAGLVEQAEDFRWSSPRADWQSARSLASCPTSGEIQVW